MRKIKQISTTRGPNGTDALYALCKDGTLWRLPMIEGAEWQPVKPILEKSHTQKLRYCKDTGSFKAVDVCTGDSPHPGVTSSKQIGIIKHALGLDKMEKMYRNHYITSKGCTDYGECEHLVVCGFMTKKHYARSHDENCFIYRVTDKGLDYIREFKL